MEVLYGSSLEFNELVDNRLGAWRRELGGSRLGWRELVGYRLGQREYDCSTLRNTKQLQVVRRSSRMQRCERSLSAPGLDGGSSASLGQDGEIWSATGLDGGKSVISLYEKKFAERNRLLQLGTEKAWRLQAGTEGERRHLAEPEGDG